MKFNYGDETDKTLTKVIAHEFSRCDFAFNLFISLKTKTILRRTLEGNNIDLMVFNAYSLFIQHLYEYLKGCFIRDRLDTSNIPYDQIDKLMNFEAGKMLNIWRILIDIGKAPEMANERSYYEVEVPEEFGFHFRSVRNNVAHVDVRRIDGGNRITLTDFYNTYHKYILLLYYNGREWWGLKGERELDLGDITSFNKLI